MKENLTVVELQDKKIKLIENAYERLREVSRDLYEFQEETGVYISEFNIRTQGNGTIGTRTVDYVFNIDFKLDL